MVAAEERADCLLPVPVARLRPKDAESLSRIPWPRRLHAIGQVVRPLDFLRRMTMDHDSVVLARITARRRKSALRFTSGLDVVRESSCRSWDAVAGRDSARVISHVGSSVVLLLARIEMGSLHAPFHIPFSGPVSIVHIAHVRTASLHRILPDLREGPSRRRSGLQYFSVEF
jgi:hypothetical protein